MDEHNTARIFGSFRPLSTTDYPGKLTGVIYFADCNLRCKYCHNHNLLKDKNKISIEDIKLELLKVSKRNFLHGITISGGEPSLFPKETEELIRYIRTLRSDWLIKIDTNGTDPEFIKHMIELGVDFIAMDYKTLDYNDKFGIKTGNILKSFDIITKAKEYEIRMTLAPSYIDVARFIQMLCILQNHHIENISLQRYVDDLAEVKETVDYTKEDFCGFVYIAELMDFNVTSRIN